MFIIFYGKTRLLRTKPAAILSTVGMAISIEMKVLRMRFRGMILEEMAVTEQIEFL